MNPGSLLAMHPGALGDAVVAFPVLRRLRSRFRRIDLLCRGEIGNLAVHLGVADRSFPLESARFAALYRERISDPDLAAFLNDDLQILLFSRSDLPERAIASVTDVPPIRISPRPPSDMRIHVADFLRAQLREKGFAVEGQGTASSPETAGDGPVLLHPGSGSPRKNWPLERFGIVFERLVGAGMDAKFLAGPAEHEMRSRLARIGETVVPDGLTALADLLRQARGFVGNDSGVGHLAAFLGVSTLTIFGPSDPVRWRPTGFRTATVGGDGPDCFPCFEARERPACDFRECLTRISPEQVLSAFGKLTGNPVV
jgi:heptosyltransferase III